jgi:general secretion pathway protein C
MLTRWSSFLVWALVAASAVFWGLRLFVQPLVAPQGTVVATAEGQLRGDLSRLLGADAPAAMEAPAAMADPRFQLLGVLSAPSSRAEREGVALIVVDDRPPRAYRVGMVVDGDTVLQAVHARGASLGPRGGVALVALELPPPAPAATGSLPGVAGARAPGMAPSPGTQVFMPPGQAAPVFTRNRSPSPAMVPPPTSMGLPPLPLAIPEQPYNGGAKSDDTAEADMMPSEEANPIR